MNIALIGASGFIGSEILNELLSRGYKVTAIVRNPEKIKPRENLIIKKGDVEDTKALTELLKGHSAVLSAYHTGSDKAVIGGKSIVEATRRAGIKRLIVVGGAGTLDVAPGKNLVDSPEFPAAWKDIALAARELFYFMRDKGNDLDWGFMSPAAMIEPGPRTGKFRVGADSVIFDDKGQSKITAADYAVAMVNELEKNQFIQKRFTVAY